MKDGATKAKTIGYWVTTGLLVFCMTGGIFELLGVKTTIEGIMRLDVARNDPAWIIVVNVAIAAITLASWALRPQSRRLGDPVKRAELAPEGS